MDDELEAMLRLDLRDYLAGDGYRLDMKESTKDSFKMRGPNAVLILRERQDGVWEYFNPLDPDDNGTIVQYLQKRRGGHFTLGHVKGHLRGFSGGVLRGPMIPGMPRPLIHAPRDLAHVARRWEQARPVWGHPHYLKARGGITAATVTAYAGALRMDRKGNVLFAHTNDGGQIVGYEIAGTTFKGFAKGGVRLLFRMGPLDGPEPAKIALTESGVEALSLAQLVGRRDTLFLSTGGALSTHTLNAIRAAATRYPAAEILLGFNADLAGDGFTASVTKALGEREAVRRVVPKAKDWNDQLTQAARLSAPAP
jgi:hypothetical protein